MALVYLAFNGNANRSGNLEDVTSTHVAFMYPQPINTRFLVRAANVQYISLIYSAYKDFVILLESPAQRNPSLLFKISPTTISTFCREMIFSRLFQGLENFHATANLIVLFNGENECSTDR